MRDEDLHALDVSYLRSAYEVAAKLSTDPSTQNGAILVSADKVHDFGGKPVKEWLSSANFFPEGVKESEERWQRPKKYMYVEHSERNLIYKAAKVGFKTDGAIMYACWASCADCARAIIQSGIRELVTHHDPLEKTRFGQPVSETWKESVAAGMTMLNEAGVTVRWISDKIFVNDELKIRFNGVLVSP